MVYRQTLSEEENAATIREVISLRQFISDTCSDRHSVFHSCNFYLLLRKQFLLRLARTVEAIFGPVYVENTYNEFRIFSAAARQTLVKLTRAGLLRGWRSNRMIPGLPYIPTLVLIPENIKPPNGDVYKFFGASGAGNGSTLSQAVLPAVGEFLERRATMMWWLQKLISCPIDIHKKNARFVSAISFCTDKAFDISADCNTQIQWIAATSWLNKRRCYVPAQVVFITTYFRNRDLAPEPPIHLTSSNGAAVQVTRRQSMQLGLMELIERDVMMRSWYHNRVLPKIPVSEIKLVLPDVANMIEKLTKNGVEVHVLDASVNEFDVPTVIIVSYQPGVRGPIVSAASSENVENCVKKAFVENLRMIHGFVHIKQSGISDLYHDGGYKPDHIDKRIELWLQVDMIPDIAWFVASKEESHPFSKTKINQTSSPKFYQRLKGRFKQLSIDVYDVNITTSECREYNLFASKVVSPQMVPVFFDEEQRPMLVDRFTKDAAGKKVALNETPHPFL